MTTTNPPPAPARTTIRCFRAGQGPSGPWQTQSPSPMSRLNLIPPTWANVIVMLPEKSTKPAPPFGGQALLIPPTADLNFPLPKRSVYLLVSKSGFGQRP